MTIFYSVSAPGFFNSDTHTKKQIPADAIAISKDVYLMLLQGESIGKRISIDEQGSPILVDPVYDPSQWGYLERIWRDTEIENVQWLRERHRDESDLERAHTLTPEQFSQLLSYLQDLRDWPQSPDFPAREQRPIQPDWIAEQTR